MMKEVQAYLHEHIPISRAIGVTVARADCEKVILSAPFCANINHKKTVFGGSLHAVATLACWSLLYVKLKKEHVKSQIVITKSDVSYNLPVDSDFQAECNAPEKAEWERFLKILKAKGKARISLSCTIGTACNYRGTFAAILTKEN